MCVCVLVFAGCQTHCGALGKGCECTIVPPACTHAQALGIFAASGGICVANVITAVQLQDDRIKLLLKRGVGGVKGVGVGRASCGEGGG